MFKPSAGQVRGFRIVRDPDGILYDPFEYNGMKLGYVITYGEGTPAVFDGDQWISVLNDEAEKSFEDSLQNLIVEQGTKIAAAIQNPVYAELATQMGMFAGVGATAASAATTTQAQGDPGPEVIRYGS